MSDQDWTFWLMMMNYAMGIVVVVIGMGVIIAVIRELSMRKSLKARFLVNEARGAPLHAAAPAVALFRWEMNVGQSITDLPEKEPKNGTANRRGAAAGSE